jgi:hypothetical protein
VCESSGTYSTDSTRISVVTDKFLRKVHFFNNYCTCALSLTAEGSFSKNSMRMLVASTSPSFLSRAANDIKNTEVNESGSASGSVIGTGTGVDKGGSWIENVNDILLSMPLATLLSRMQDNSSGSTTKQGYREESRSSGQENAMQVVNEDDADIPDDSSDVEISDNSDDIKIGEQAFALAGGMKRLEYRSSAVLKAIRCTEVDSLKALKGAGREKGGSAGAGKTERYPVLSASVPKQAQTPSATSLSGDASSSGTLNNALAAMEAVLKVLTANQAVSVLTDAISSSCSSENVSAIFAVVKSYTKILMSCPVGTDTTTASVPLSISILNAMAFSRPKDPLTKRLWGLLSSFDPSIVSEAINRIAPTALASVPVTSYFSTHQTANSTAAPHLSITGQVAARLGISPSALCDGLQSSLYLLCCVLSHQLTATDDEEFFELGGEKGDLPGTEQGAVRKMLPMREIKLLIPMLKIALYKLYWSHPSIGMSDRETPSSPDPTSSSALIGLQVCTSLICCKLVDNFLQRVPVKTYYEHFLTLCTIHIFSTFAFSVIVIFPFSYCVFNSLLLPDADSRDETVQPTIHKE